MPVVDAYAERRYQRMMESAFGHLRAKPGQEFTGHMVFAFSLEGYQVLLDFDFAGLDCSPWLHEDAEDFMWAKCKERGQVYRFDGRYVVHKSGRRRFIGRVRRVNIERLTRR
jgi:hypothetical protein